MYCELESARVDFERSKILAAETLFKIHSSQSVMPSEVWGEVCGLYYCLLTSKELISTRASINTDSQAVFKTCLELLPEDKREQIKMVKAFEQKVQATVN